jgi:restriction system protein
MAVPDFQTLMLPVLKVFADGKERTPAEVRGPIAAEFQLSEADLATLLPSGRQSTFNNRVAWALGYLKQAQLLESPRRSVYRITARGEDALKASPSRIDIAYLDRYPEFVAFRSATGPSKPPKSLDPALQKLMTEGIPASIDGLALTPDEQVRVGAASLRESLAAQLLERVKQTEPSFFEKLVIDLLVAMNYGGSHEDAAKVVGRAGDGGIDGIIKEDRLGLDSIYVQAKRWEGVVGRPVVQQFAGALQGQRARKGVLITTSSFTREAIEYAGGLQSTIILVDGTQLTQLMIDYNIGVADLETIKLKRVDEDYYAED